MLLSLNFERAAIAQAAGPAKQYPPDAFVRIGDDGTITISVIATLHCCVSDRPRQSSVL
jgi:hypothetical protein